MNSFKKLYQEYPKYTFLILISNIIIGICSQTETEEKTDFDNREIIELILAYFLFKKLKLENKQFILENNNNFNFFTYFSTILQVKNEKDTNLISGSLNEKIKNINETTESEELPEKSIISTNSSNIKNSAGNNKKTVKEFLLQRTIDEKTSFLRLKLSDLPIEIILPQKVLLQITKMGDKYVINYDNTSYLFEENLDNTITIGRNEENTIQIPSHFTSISKKTFNS